MAKPIEQTPPTPDAIERAVARIADDPPRDAGPSEALGPAAPEILIRAALERLRLCGPDGSENDGREYAYDIVNDLAKSGYVIAPSPELIAGSFRAPPLDGSTVFQRIHAAIRCALRPWASQPVPMGHHQRRTNR